MNDTITFDPASDFKTGEMVTVTLTKEIQGLEGVPWSRR
jgi:hypothetical protein